MVIHDYQTSISCERCSDELQVERHIKENTMRKIAAKSGWVVLDGKDYCPNCGAKMDGGDNDA